MSTEPKTLFEKVWERHVVVEPEGEPTVLYIDLQLLHEVTSPQAFEGLRLAGRKVRRPDRCIATVDHNVPTTIEGRLNILDQIAAKQIRRCARTARSSASNSTTWTRPIRASSTSSGRSWASPSRA
jgi:homoaconitase/3-isopropylmalate dehydratase large subunit